MSITRDALDALRQRCDGPVVAADDVAAVGELAGRRLDHDGPLLAVVGAAHAGDVAAVLRWAARVDVAVVVPGSGHLGDGHGADDDRADGHRADDDRADGHRADDDRADGHRADGGPRPAVVVTRTRIDRIAVHPQSGRLRAGAGARWAALRRAAREAGLVADVPDLSSPVADVGTHALLRVLPVAPVVAVELVTGDGDVHRVARGDGDLWRSLASGSDRAGVVTGIELDLAHAPAARRPAPPAARTWTEADDLALASRHDPDGVLRPGGGAALA